MFPDIPTLFQRLTDFILWIPRYIWQIITDDIIAMFTLVFEYCTGCSLGSSASNVEIAWSSLGSGVLYLLSWFDLGQGMTTIMCAYIIRFFIRRIPVIG